MEESKRRAYSEVVEVLKLIEDEEKMEKIPFEVIELIKRNSDPEYKPETIREKSLEEQNISQEAFSILGWIADKYWGVNLFETTSNNFQETSQTENIEENKEIKIYNDIEPEILDMAENIPENNLPIVVSNISWYKKIARRVVLFFKTLFKIQVNNSQEGVKNEN